MGTTEENDDVNVEKNKNNENEIEEAKKDHHDDDDDSKARNDKEESTDAAAAPAISPSNSVNENLEVLVTNKSKTQYDILYTQKYFTIHSKSTPIRRRRWDRLSPGQSFKSFVNLLYCILCIIDTRPAASVVQIVVQIEHR